MAARFDSSLVPVLLVAGLAMVSLWTRPLWPIDETRYVGVAWEMWQRGDFLVPHLNGEPYSHKPPLLFWLTHAGWAVFGVSDWWPRLVPSLFALCSLALTGRLARLLWPEAPRVAGMATWILLGSLLWTVFVTLTMFDMLVTTFAALGMVGLATAWRGRMNTGFATIGIAIAGGLLAKGPVILLHVLPAALMAPWFMGRDAPRRGRWYAGVALATALGAAIALAWALPAARAGGSAYETEILWGQTAGRMATSFAHRRPWWWYLPLLPVLLFPWLAWPPVWRALAGLRRGAADPGIRFVLAWVVPAFLAFSLVSGKQPHYLLPLVVGFALVAARMLDGRSTAPRRADMLPPAILLVAAGVVWCAVALGVRPPGLPGWAEGLSPVLGAVLAATGVALAGPRPSTLPRVVRTLAISTVVLVALAHVGVIRLAAPVNDPGPVAGHLGRLERAGRSLAFVGKYHGQFQFAGRLARPLDEIAPTQVGEWIARHPDGRVVTYEGAPPGGGQHGPGVAMRAPAAEWRVEGAAPEYARPFRGRQIYVWTREAIAGATGSGAR
jgi:4-amino-4-deoxy-L-arabinose transferase-like glycosyltransferase